MKPQRYEGPVPVHPRHLRSVEVNGAVLDTDAEGYLVHRDKWSEDFARVVAARHGLVLTDEHWLVIRFIRNQWRTRGRLASLRQIAHHFRTVWGTERGSPAYLFRLFEVGGGPEKLGHRLAGVPRLNGDS